MSLFILCSCGGSDDETTIEDINEAPTVPILVYPSNNLLCIENGIDFQWNASTDVNEDIIDYTIQVSTDSQFNSIDFTENVPLTSQFFTLSKGVVYYWRVKATDINNASSDYSLVNSFITEGDGVSNHLPFPPELINPALSSVVNDGSVVLEWSASDVDEDPLTFDIYLGTENPPTNIISENQTDIFLNVSTISQTIYYWKVVVKDNNGAQTIGQTWSFSTN